MGEMKQNRYIKMRVAAVLCVLLLSMLFVTTGARATADSNNDFTDAVEVFNNDVIIESVNATDDVSDYYKIYLDAGDKVIAYLGVPTDQDFDLYLYDSSYTLLNYSEIDNPGTGVYYEVVSGSAGTSGWYYLNVSAYNGSGFYSLRITATAKWTFMVYMDGDNNVETPAINDFIDIANAGSSRDVDIVVQFDRWDGYVWDGASWNYESADDSRFGNWTDCNRYLVEQGMTPTPENAWANGGEVDMGDPQTLVDFGNWAVQTFPAHHYALVLWDHGGSWVGTCWDDYSKGSNLNMSNLSSALQTIQTDNGGLKMDIIGFDSCLMAGLEVGYQIKDYGDYMVASEKTEPGISWDFNRTLNALRNNPSMSPADFSTQIVNDYVDFFEYYQFSDVTLSSVDLAKIGDVATATDNLATELRNNMDLYINYVNYSRNKTETYDGPYAGQHQLPDLYDFAQQIESYVPDAAARSLAGNLMNSIDASVIAERHWNRTGSMSVENAHGLTIYFPETRGEYLAGYEDSPYEDPSINFPADTNWDEFLNEFYTKLWYGNVDPTIDTVSPTRDPTINEGESQTFSITASDADGNALQYQWQLDGAVVATGTTYTFNADYNSSGSYTVELYVWDGVWNYDSVDFGWNYSSWTLTVNDVDITPPISWADSISTYYQGSATVLTATAADSDSEVSNVTLWYRYSSDNSTWGTWTVFRLDTASPWGWNFNFPDGDGYYEFYTIAEDTANNTETKAQVAESSCVYDTGHPEISINPLADSYIPSSSVTVEWSGSDALSGIGHYEVRVDGSSWTDVGISTSHIFTGLSDGSHTVYIKAVDTVGNEWTVSSEFKTDSTPPEIIIVSPSNGSLCAPNIVAIWIGNDSVSGIASYMLKIDTAAWIDFGVHTNYTMNNLADGEHLLEIRATDGAGLINITNVTFTVDAVKPVVIEHSPNGTEVPIDSSISVTFNESMNESSVNITVNGISGNISWSNNTATFTPSENLSYGIEYTVNVTGSDIVGNPMDEYQWSFTTIRNVGTLTGRVLDENGNPIVGANITLDTGETTTTDENGNFSVETSAGSHVLTISKDGYEVKTENVTAILGTETPVEPLKLPVAAQSSEESAGPFPWMYVFLAVIIGIAAILLLVRGKKTGAPENPVKETEAVEEENHAEETDTEKIEDSSPSED